MKKLLLLTTLTLLSGAQIFASQDDRKAPNFNIVNDDSSDSVDLTEIQSTDTKSDDDMSCFAKTQSAFNTWNKETSPWQKLGAFTKYTFLHSYYIPQKVYRTFSKEDDIWNNAGIGFAAILVSLGLVALDLEGLRQLHNIFGFKFAEKYTEDSVCAQTKALFSKE